MYMFYFSFMVLVFAARILKVLKTICQTFLMSVKVNYFFKVYHLCCSTLVSLVFIFSRNAHQGIFFENISFLSLVNPVFLLFFLFLPKIRATSARIGHYLGLNFTKKIGIFLIKSKIREIKVINHRINYAFI